VAKAHGCPRDDAQISFTAMLIRLIPIDLIEKLAEVNVGILRIKIK